MLAVALIMVPYSLSCGYLWQVAVMRRKRLNKRQATSMRSSQVSQVTCPYILSNEELYEWNTSDEWITGHQERRILTEEGLRHPM